MPIASFDESAFNTFIQSEQFSEIPKSIREFYNKNKDENRWILKVWFVHQENCRQYPDSWRILGNRLNENPIPVDIKQACMEDPKENFWRLKFWSTHFAEQALFDRDENDNKYKDILSRRSRLAKWESDSSFKKRQEKGNKIAELMNVIPYLKAFYITEPEENLWAISFWLKHRADTHLDAAFWPIFFQFFKTFPEELRNAYNRDNNKKHAWMLNFWAIYHKDAAESPTFWESFSQFLHSLEGWLHFAYDLSSCTEVFTTDTERTRFMLRFLWVHAKRLTRSDPQFIRYEFFKTVFDAYDSMPVGIKRIYLNLEPPFKDPEAALWTVNFWLSNRAALPEVFDDLMCYWDQIPGELKELYDKNPKKNIWVLELFFSEIKELKDRINALPERYRDYEPDLKSIFAHSDFHKALLRLSTRIDLERLKFYFTFQKCDKLARKIARNCLTLESIVNDYLEFGAFFNLPEDMKALYLENPRKNRDIITFWFLRPSIDVSSSDSTLPTYIQLIHAERSPEHEWITLFWHKHHATVDTQFWKTLLALCNTIGLARVKFYYTYNRLARLIQWVNDKHLTLDQVREYDTIKSYERKPKAPQHQALSGAQDEHTILTEDWYNRERSVSDSSSDDDTRATETTVVDSFQQSNANPSDYHFKEDIDPLYSYPYGKEPLGFEFTAQDSERYMHSVSRKLPHLLANDAYQDDDTPPLTPKERARYDMDAENPRHHLSRKMKLYVKGFHTSRNRDCLEEGGIQDYLYLRYYEEYLDTFYDQVILPMAEERARLFDELKAIHIKIASFGEAEPSHDLMAQQKLLEEKIDLLSGCLKQQCRELKKYVVNVGNTRVTGKYNFNENVHIVDIPLKVYQDSIAPDAEYVAKYGVDLLCDNHYRTEHTEKCCVDEVNINTLKKRAEQLDNVPLEQRPKSTLPQWRNPLAAFFKALLGVAVGLATAAILVPAMAIEAVVTKCTGAYPKIWNSFNGTFFRSHSHQSSFEAEKKSKEIFDLWSEKAKNSRHTASDLDYRFHGTFYEKDFRQWQKGEPEQPAPNFRR